MSSRDMPRTLFPLRYVALMQTVLVLRTLLLVLFLLIRNAGQCSASTVLPLDLEQTVRLAGYAFSGTATSIKSAALPAVGPITYVTFSDLNLAKGTTPKSEITIVMRGGTVGPLTSFVVGQPTFTLNERYVVFAYESLGSPEDDYLPIVGLYQGVFPIGNRAASGEGGIIRDWEGREVVGSKGTHLVVVGGAEAKDGTALAVRKVDVQQDPSVEVQRPRVDSRVDQRRARVRHPLPRVNAEATREPSRPIAARVNSKVAAINEQLASENRVPIEIIDQARDPHTRMSEQEFLTLIRTFASR